MNLKKAIILKNSSDAGSTLRILTNSNFNTEELEKLTGLTFS